MQLSKDKLRWVRAHLKVSDTRQTTEFYKRNNNSINEKNIPRTQRIIEYQSPTVNYTRNFQHVTSEKRPTWLFSEV